MKTMRQVFGEALRDAASIYPQLRVLDADVSSSTQTRIFKEAYPDRFFNFGIAEGNMAAAAAGMAACGQIPVISTFAFLMGVRAMDPIHSLIAYNHLNVKIAGGYSGLSDHADGASHQAVCDIAMLRSLPAMVVLAPSDEESTVQSVLAMLRYEGPVYLRLSRDKAERIHQGGACVEIGRAFELLEGRDVGIVTTGTMLASALEARQLLKRRGIEAGIIESICVKPLDVETICRAADRYGCLVTLEEHNVIGGLGDAVCAAVCAHKPVPVCRIGMEDCFGQSARSYQQLLQAYALDGAGVATKVEHFLRRL